MTTAREVEAALERLNRDNRWLTISGVTAMVRVDDLDLALQEIGRLRAALRLNGLRHSVTHAEIDAVLFREDPPHA